MFGFLKRRMWKEQVKLATQNALACRYIVDFESSLVAAGLRFGSQFQSPAETDLETANGYLSDLRSGEPLPAMIVSDALQMNSELRREYDAVIQASSNAVALIGSERLQLLPFDQMFSPGEGWSTYFLNFRSPFGASVKQEATKQTKGVGQSPENVQYLDDLIKQGEMAGMDPKKLREAFENVEPKRLRELEAMGAELARMDAEQNLRVRTERLLQRQLEGQSQHTRTTNQEKTPDIGGQWTVYVDDNFHYMDEGERYALGSFDCYESAVLACQKIVDEFLENNSAETGDKLFESYVKFGEDPWITGPNETPDQPVFSARDYARQRCNER